jgi:hypothetical protein
MKHDLILCGETIPHDTGHNPRGVIHLANASRFNAANLSQPLTTFAVGWKDPNLQATLDAVAPAVPVPKRFSFKKTTNAEAFLSETDDIRAVGAAFKRVEYTGTEVESRCLNKGLTVLLDKDEDLMDEEAVVGRLQTRILRSDLRRAFVALLAAATNDNKTWNSSADPDSDIARMMSDSGDTAGLEPNVVVIGASAWLKRFQSLSAQATSGGFRASLTPAQLADLLGLERIVISRERYQSGTSAKSQVLGAYVLAYLAMQGQGKDDPSAIKRFTTPASGGGQWAVFREEKNNGVELTVEHYSNLVITGVGIRKLTIS